MINTLDGMTFARMIISGANNLYNNKQTVDELNVFPVPDGDTGTNMSLTVTAMSAELENKAATSLAKTAEVMSFSTLRGARGNSGVILSQFFRGISKYLKGKDECDAAEFAAALEAGSAAAYKAVMKPTEGTILTVAREAATGASLQAQTSSDIEEVLGAAVERGNKALKRTTQQLPALSQAGVVDAGGQGWMFVLEGALYFLQNGKPVIKEASEEPQLQKPKAAQTSVDTKDIKFKYCTEFIIEKHTPGESVDAFKSAISPKGDCMLVIDDEDVVKVHIHSNHPGFVIEEAIKLGELINLKIDNMKHQHKSIIDKGQKKPAKAPKEKKPVEIKKYGFAAVSAGKGFSNILKDMGIEKIIEGGQTMNPSTDDILRAIKRIKAQTVFVFPNNKNIIMAAQQAAQLANDKRVIVIPSKSVPQCISAMLAFNEKKEPEANEKAMSRAISRVSSGQVTYAVRDTELDGVEIKKDDILGIKESDIELVGHNPSDVLEELTASMVDEDSEFITIYYGRDIKKPEAAAVAAKLEAKYADEEIEVSLKKGGQPVYYYVVSVE
ncbi:MAG: DAK2 domain-containing protein [Clostridiales bacterium]|nr:DAK2 domain-containing protein [Clostridiales bacterium]